MTETPKVYKLNKEKRASDNPGNLFILKSGKTQKDNTFSQVITYIPKTGDFRLQTVTLPIGRF